MSIDSIKSSIPQIQGITTPNAIQPNKPTNSTDFSKMFKNALGEVDQMQKDADQKITDLTLGTGKTTSHEAMIALEKADIAFQLMTNVRAKIIRAYEDVLRTQV